jgi:hypothetical protein
MRNVTARRLATPDFSWAERIPELLTNLRPPCQQPVPVPDAPAADERTTPATPV